MRPRIFLGALLALAAWPGLADDPVERIAFQRNDPPAVTVMFLNGAEAADLAPNRKISPPYLTPALAPNGNTIAFAALSDGQYKLFTWRLDERNVAVGDPKRLTPETSDVAERFPSWSPDGRQLAFLATDKENARTLRLVNADGSNMITLTTVNYNATPTWSPDGRQLLYIDLVAGKPVLHNIPAAGGKGIPVRPDSRIIAACYAPDGKQIAAMIEGETGSADLYILPPFGIGGRPVLRNIVGVKSLCWRKGDVIIFNASKVGGQGGKAFWSVGVNGDNLKGVTGYADPKQVAYFSVEIGDLTPYVPVAVLPTAPEVGPTLPPEVPDDTRQPDLSVHLAMHAVTITSPLAGGTVQGKVPIEFTARKSVSSISLLVNGEFVSSFAVDNSKESVVKTSYILDTQQLSTTSAVRLSEPYAKSLRYPDGTYTLCAQALDAGKRVVDQHTITVTIRNALPGNALPGDTATLLYSFGEQNRTEYFRVYGDARLLGANGQADELNASLEVAIRRILQRPLTNGSYPFRTEACGPGVRPSLTFGQYEQMNLPEFVNHGTYTLDPQGEIVPTAAGGVYLPLAQLALPVPEGPVKVGTAWEKPMWVVTDLLDREATRVDARHVVEGMEWIDGRRAVRIRSDFRLENDLTLHTLPAAFNPGLRGTRAKALRQGGKMPETAKLPPIRSIDVWKVTGVRYTWFDMEGKRLLKVDDRILHTVLTRNLLRAGAAPTAEMEQSTSYLVHYQYISYEGK